MLDPVSNLAARPPTAPTLAPPITPDDVAAPTRRSHRFALTGTVSIVGAVIVHALLLVAFAAIVWRTAGGPTPRGPEVAIDFNAPAFGEAPAPLPPTINSAPDRVAEREVTIVMPSEASPAPVIDVPSLASLANAPVADPAAESNAPALPALAPSAFVPPSVPAGATAAPVAEIAGTPGRVIFAGLGASNARSVVYCIDASGSMVTSLPFVIAEVERSVSGLSPTQKFGVVLYRKAFAAGEVATEVFAPVLVRATPSARERLRDWLAHAEPSGRSVPLLGLERALSYQPDAVFLLSRSIERSGGNIWERGLADTLGRVNALNPDLGGGRRAVVIQTIQFLDDDPTGIMQEIGRIHGARTDAAGRLIAGYRVIRRGEELGASADVETGTGGSGGGR